MSNVLGTDDDHELTDEERRAIASLKRLAKRWPKSLWLFATGSLHVMKGRGEVFAKGDYHPLTRSYDERDSVTTIDIPCDGGDF